LVRVDHNVVKKGKIKDGYRIDASVPTIKYIIENGGKPILMSHIGRVFDKKTGTIDTSPLNDVQPLVEYLKTKYNLTFCVPKCICEGDKGYTGFDPSVKEMINDMNAGKFDGMYIPNTRFFQGEEAKDDRKEKFGKELSALADIFVNDAFGSWQPHASVVCPTDHIPSFAGLLMQKEIENLNAIFNPKKPLTAVVAGSKFDTKIKSLSELIKVADHLILGGVIFNAYIAAKYDITIKGIDEEDMKIAQDFVTMSESMGGKVVEPTHIVESLDVDPFAEGGYTGNKKTHKISDLKPGTQLNYVLDVAQESFNDPNLTRIVEQSSTFFINAVMGFTPNFTEGTIGMYTLIAENKSALKLYGGGDTLQEFKGLLPDLYNNALNDNTYYFFTGGGTVLTAIEQGSPWNLDMLKALMKGK
jgi:phosphoglycerate kinase